MASVNSAMLCVSSAIACEGLALAYIIVTMVDTTVEMAAFMFAEEVDNVAERNNSFTEEVDSCAERNNSFAEEVDSCAERIFYIADMNISVAYNK